MFSPTNLPDWKDKDECDSCEATGLYVGLGEATGTASRCWDCEGTGAVPKGSRKSNGNSFTGLKLRKDVKIVRSLEIGLDVGGAKTSRTVTYDQFLKDG